MAKNKAYRIAEGKIEEALRSKAKVLDLSISFNDKETPRLTELPESLGQLTQLQELNLSGNRLTMLPEWVGQLKQLQRLGISYNKFTKLPESLNQLTNLRSLLLYGNQITSLPTLGNLTRLTSLYLDNPIQEIPAWVCKLRRLRALAVGSSELSVVPDWIGDLVNLETLYLQYNRLTDLPQSLTRLGKLKKLELDGNPLNPELTAAHEKGVKGVKSYLRELAKGQGRRYEAKLLILGDGNEGKTCISRALRDLPFSRPETTQGVDVAQWRFPHPDDVADPQKEITLNIWDFEGQEISHQTHQFFLSGQSLYLVVFKCRDLFLMDRAEYWLDTIRARAPKAKVVIVISECEQRSPHVPLDRIEAQYGDMLAEEWFFAVGCENGKDVAKLQTFLKSSAAKLEFMGSHWPASYEKAEAEIKVQASQGTAHISRSQLNNILRTVGVNEDNHPGATDAMARIGALTQFPDSPDLRDFVVLQPQWLTKAISKVMEDGQLAEDKGEIALQRLDMIWNQAQYSGMFATFHNCMKEFELCYDLEEHRESCLVPLRFGYVAPSIPWTDKEEIKERRIEYKLNIRPPMGIMSRFIVKTHHMIVKTAHHPKGIYWYNGVFLRATGSLPSEALCEFVPEDRIFRVRVRAAFPQRMCEQIHAYIEAVFAFFSGLSAERSYGCIKVDEQSDAESQCKGLHSERRIYTAIAKKRATIDCEFEEHEVDPRRLVSGFSSFGDYLEGRLRTIVNEAVKETKPDWAEPFLRGLGGLLDWAQTNADKLDQLLHGQAALKEEFKQEAELKLHEYLAYMSQMLDDRDHTAAPGLISIMAKDRSSWNPVGYFKRTYVLTPFCECEGNIHACEDGNVEFMKDRDWWIATAPWIARATQVLAAGLKLGFAGIPLALGSDTAKLIEDQVKFMDKLTEHVKLDSPKKLEDTGADEVLHGEVGKDLRSNDRESAITRTALARFLEDTAPNNYRARRWGSLKRVKRSDNSYRWLCEACAK